MKARIFLAIFLIGVLAGVMIFSQPSIKDAITGKAIEDCYVENELCKCNKEECVCGNQIVAKDACIN